VVPTATCRLLFVLVFLAHKRRRIVHVAVTDHPTAAWTTQQLREAFPWDQAPRYVVRDRDHAFDRWTETAKAMGIEEVLTGTAFTVAERVLRPDPYGASASTSHRIQRSRTAVADGSLLCVLRTIADSLVARQGPADSSANRSAQRRPHRGDPASRRPSSPLRTARGLTPKSPYSVAPRLALTYAAIVVPADRQTTRVAATLTPGARGAREYNRRRSPHIKSTGLQELLVTRRPADQVSGTDTGLASQPQYKLNSRW
jgi:hypothetical protein